MSHQMSDFELNHNIYKYTYEKNCIIGYYLLEGKAQCDSRPPWGLLGGWRTVPAVGDTCTEYSTIEASVGRNYLYYYYRNLVTQR